MCGISGIFDSRGTVSTDMLHHMAGSLAHRGPDDEGVWLHQSCNVGFSHSRLSILDLSVMGRQPMMDDSENVVITYNGEIYNFVDLRRELEKANWSFRTRTDTEVILYAYRQWGISCISKFNGMFAFALYDSQDNSIYLVRDRMGKKPLYFWAHQYGLAFASECKTILELKDYSPSLNWNAVNFYFAFGYVPGNLSIFQGVNKLSMGCYLRYDCSSRKYTIVPYWTLPFDAEAPPVKRCKTELLDELSALLEDSVRLRLISDVPVGILLSGGVDSSLVTAMAAQVTSGKVKTFTIAFPEDNKYNEAPYAKLVAEHFDTEHHVLPVVAEEFKDFSRLSHHLDEPLADPSFIPTYVVSRLTRRHVKVALGGDGGDELFGGYQIYRAGLKAYRYLELLPRLGKKFVEVLLGHIPPGVRGTSFLRCLTHDLCEFIISWRAIYTSELRKRLFVPELRRYLASFLDEPEIYKRQAWENSLDPVAQMTTLDLQTYLVDDILCKVDRASMASSLEIRAPWLDHRIVSFALKKVPSDLKVNTKETRIIERLLARRVLPRQLDLHRKQGFVMPIRHWISGYWGDRILDLLETSKIGEWFDRDFIRSMLINHRQGLNNSMRLYAFLVFAEWYTMITGS